MVIDEDKDTHRLAAVCLSVCLYMCGGDGVCVFVCLSVYVWGGMECVCSSVCLSVCICGGGGWSVCVRLSVWGEGVCVCWSVCLSVCLSVCDVCLWHTVNIGKFDT